MPVVDAVVLGRWISLGYVLGQIFTARQWSDESLVRQFLHSI